MAKNKSNCVACEINQMTRNHYFTGKLLVERDFTDEQQYFLGKDRRHNRLLHGSGVVCGLRVKEHPNPDCQDQYVIVEPGVAVDCCGREIVVEKEQYVDVRAMFEAYREKQNGETEEEPEPQNLLLCLRYTECAIEDMPVLFDDCGCDDTATQPNRILESYEFELRSREQVAGDGSDGGEQRGLLGREAGPVDLVPDPREDISEEIEEAIAPRETWRACVKEIESQLLAGCPTCEDACVAIAAIHDFAPGRLIRNPAPSSDGDNGEEPDGANEQDAARIDTRARVHLPSTTTLLEVIRCLRQYIEAVDERDASLNNVNLEIVGCDGEPQAGFSGQGEQRTLNLVIPTRCGQEDGIDDVDIKFVSCEADPVVEIREEDGERVLFMRLPKCPEETEAEEIPLTQVACINWRHADQEVEAMWGPNASVSQAGILIYFNGKVRAGDINPHTLQLLVQKPTALPEETLELLAQLEERELPADLLREILLSLRRTGPECWCPVRAEVVRGIDLVIEENPATPLCIQGVSDDQPADENEIVNGAQLRPATPLTEGTTYRVVLKGDLIEGERDGERHSVDGNHLYPWLPNMASGDGTPGGTFESWFTYPLSNDE